MKVALYCRVGHPSQLDNEALSAQENNLRLYAEKNGMTVSGVFHDTVPGISFDRPSWNRMIAEMKAGKHNAVLATNTSRISRSTCAALEMMEKLDGLGIKTLFASNENDLLNASYKTQSFYKKMAQKQICPIITRSKAKKQANRKFEKT